MPKSVPRDVGPIIQWIRNRLLMRQVVTSHRFEEYYSPRTLPKVELPKGENDHISSNDYFQRDGRRMMGNPEKIDLNLNKKFTGESYQPGKIHRYD
ncbi:hypothetical protein SNEBB_008225 [Seison nebaliae]|nr:hypothetical protein SNEBB_008225 [Seison nebaliae]